MIVGALRLRVHVEGSQSLKDKRAVVRSLVARIANQFKVSVAEVGDLDQWQAAEIGVVCVSNSRRHADEILSKIAQFAEANAGDGIIADVQTEIIHLG